MGCMMCPHKCQAQRENGKTGRCGVTYVFKIARAALHEWEEPCISVGAGSGTVFFSGCPLHCVFCQNRAISDGKAGMEITPERLYEIFFELKEKGAANINLVTPTHYALNLVPVLEKARLDGLEIPVVYNSGGYESVETLKALEGLIDVYMPDLKYLDPDLAARYSGARDYPHAAVRAIGEMVRQRPYPIWDGEKLIRGVLVRHLVLPGQTAHAARVLRYLAQEYGEDILISMMSQYTPIQDAPIPQELQRPLSSDEHEAILKMVREIGLETIYTQEPGSAKESFIPPFDLTGV